MNRVGQCPSCCTRYELDQDDLGHLLECDCGVTLLACRAESVPTIPVVCDACHSRYDLAQEDAGHSVECECGRQFFVPSVVLRQPIGTAADLKVFGREAHRPANEIESTTKTTADAISAINGVAPADKKLDEKDQAKSEKSSESPGKSLKAKVSWESLATIGGVSVLLLVAVVMFWRRDLSPRPAKKKAAQRVSVDPLGPNGSTPVSPAGQPSPNLPATNGDAVMGNVGASDSGRVADVSQSMVAADVVVSGSATQAGEEGSDSPTASDQYPVPVAPLYALPEPQQARPRIPLVFEKQPFMTLQAGVEEAFEAYEETQGLMLTSEETKSPSDVQAFHQSLGRTIALISHVHGLAVAEADLSQINSMRYLLAYLYYSAGHLPEAGILGEAVARWGDVKEPATKEAAMIALAATQEACEIQWGDPESVGELYQMESIATLLQERWPDDSQLGLVWMNLAYLYEAFNRPDLAVAVYDRLPPKSRQYADAQVSSGIARWMIARRNRNNGEEFDPQVRRLAEQCLKRGLRILEKGVAKPTEKTLEARLNLAQIALSDDRPDEAESWLIGEDGDLLDLLVVGEPNEDDDNAVIVTATMARQLYDALYYARQQQGDSQGAQSALERLAETTDSGEIDIEARRMSTVKRTVNRLKASSVVTRKEVEELADLTRPLMENRDTVPTSSLLWLGESWGQIGLLVSDRNVAKRCASNAADLYGESMMRTDFPAPSMQAAQLRQIELLRLSGEVRQSLRIIEEVLAKTPNVYSMQIAAAESLQAIASQSGSVGDWQAAMNGPSGFSPIWGWGKLVTTLHAARWSDSATETQKSQFKMAQFNLAQCQLTIAKRMPDPAVRKLRLAEVSRSIATIMATMDPQDDWHPRFRQLQGDVNKAMR